MQRRLSPLFLSCAMLFAAGSLVAETPAYRQLTPMVAIHASNLSDAIRLFNDGLAGAGVETQPAECAKKLADLCFLPSFNGVDPSKPIRYFLLSQNPPVAMPEQAVILPLRQDSAPAIMRSLRERYAIVEGGSIKICAEPIDGKSADPLYIAIADGNAMLSPNVDAIRWMAYNLQSKTIPAPPDFRQAPLSATIDAKLLGLLLELIASLDEDGGQTEGTTADNLFMHIRELGVFLSAFQRVDATIDASLSQWDASFRLVGAPGSAIAEAIAALKPPDDTWMQLFPNYACNRSASCLPGFVTALPASNRKWLAELADETHIMGFGVIPSAFVIDEKLRPYLSGTALSAFVADVANQKLGSVTINALKSPEAAMKILNGYFAANGLASANRHISGIVPNDGNGEIAYDTSWGNGTKQKTGVGSAGETVSFVLNLNHVELAVRGNRLFIVRGAPGLINAVADKTPAQLDERISSLTAIFPNQPGETVLGGGSLEPVTLARRIVMAIRDLGEYLPKMPHQGGGFAWRMSRKGGEARFDLRLYSNEIIACNMLRQVNSETMEQILSQLVMRHFKPSINNEGQGGKLREKLDELRDK